MKRNILVLAAAAAVLITGPVLAQGIGVAPPVTVPWGDWIDAGITQVILPILGTVITAAVLWASQYLPASLRAYVTAKNTAALNQLLVPAIATGFKDVATAVEGKTLSFSVGSPEVSSALQYALDHGASYLVKWAGGPEGIQQKIVARVAMATSPVAKAVAAVTTTPTPK